MHSKHHKMWWKILYLLVQICLYESAILLPYYRLVGACFLILGGDKQSQKTKYVKICPLILNSLQQHGLMHLDPSSCPLLHKSSDTTWELKMGLMCISARVQVCYNSFSCNMSCFKHVQFKLGVINRLRDNDMLRYNFMFKDSYVMVLGFSNNREGGSGFR